MIAYENIVLNKHPKLFKIKYFVKNLFVNRINDMLDTMIHEYFFNNETCRVYVCVCRI